ncbi:hypothetical protein JXB01_00745 [Candidatus Micrarchaeota archaeon]|nr:hypothetical protein [Candidatus Micrarchaeota archaeon]
MDENLRTLNINRFKLEDKGDLLKTAPSLDQSKPSSKEISSKNRKIMHVKNEWKKTDASAMHVSELYFFEGESLEDLDRIYRPEGTEVINLTYKNSTYLLRLTTEKKARALLKFYNRLKNSIENIVGFLKTTLNSVYILSKFDEKFWTFDHRLKGGKIAYVHPLKLGSTALREVSDSLIRSLSILNKKRFFVSEIGFRNILFNERSAILTDLRNLQYARKGSPAVREFKNLMKKLASVLWLNKPEIIYLIALYMGGAEELCCEWYSSKFKKSPEESVDILEALEKNITGSLLS